MDGSSRSTTRWRRSGLGRLDSLTRRHPNGRNRAQTRCQRQPVRTAGSGGYLPLAPGVSSVRHPIRQRTFKYVATVQSVTDETCQTLTFTAHEVVRRVVVNHRISIQWSSTFPNRRPPFRLAFPGELTNADACEPVGWSTFK
jgi:hypothetical protein